MTNRLVIFPISKLTSAEAYVAECNTHFAANYELNGLFGAINYDVFGQPVAPFYGPPYLPPNLTEFEEPVGFADLREDGVLHDFAVWPAP